MEQQTALNQVLSDIKAYMWSLDRPGNTIYQENELLILSCFNKAMEICESRLPMETEQIKQAYLRGIKNYDPTFKGENQE